MFVIGTDKILTKLESICTVKCLFGPKNFCNKNSKNL